AFPVLGFDLGQYRLDSELIDAAQPSGRYAQPHPAVLALDPEAPVVEIGLKGSDRLIVGVGHIVALHRLFAGDLTDAGHRNRSRQCAKGADFTTTGPARRRTR